MDDKLTFFGALDVVARTLEDIPESFQRLYDKGTYRMRKEDIARMQKYLRRIGAASGGTRRILSKFKSITS